MTQSAVFLLPQVSYHQLEGLGFFSEHSEQIEVSQLTQDWETVLCEKLGYSIPTLPWSLLRKQQFNLSSKVQTVCCCDPVVNQVTHRGAYMLGQSQLNLSPNDAIQIVTKINETLMESHEQVYLIDQFSWLYCSEKPLDLQSETIGDLTGKDLFNFSYQGKDTEFFSRLNNEIQMLIKQMVDYDSIPAPSGESILNVHFYDCLDLNRENEIPFIKNEQTTLITNNDLLKTFCMNAFVKQKSVHQLNEVNSKQQIYVALDTEKELYQALVSHWLSLSVKQQKNHPAIICQDAKVNFKTNKNWLSKLFNRNQ